MTTDPPSEKLLTACYHEAGHALVADLEGVPIKSVRASATGTGGVNPEDSESADPMAVLRVAHAGAGAERVGLGHKGARLDVDDMDGLIAYQAKQKIGPDHWSLDREAEKHVDALLKQHERELHALTAFICDRANTGDIPWTDIKAELDRIRAQTDD